jgi:hypothetical protein
MLAHLLDPAGSHAQRTRFLSDFLNIVQAAADGQRKNLHLPRPEDSAIGQWRCEREFLLPRDLGKADVILYGPSLLLVIENKIFAGDQANQLQRYWDFAKPEAERKCLLPVIVYLTPEGHRPSEQSLGDSTELEEHLVLLSYHEDIYQFIQHNAEDLSAISVTEVLRQYADLVRRLR